MFRLANTLEFPNDCGYQDSENFAVYNITTASEFAAFGSSLGNAKGGVITTLGNRKPFFKWTKSQDSSFNESPFRKIYVDGGPTTFEDTIGKEEGLESCFNYLLESDCNCDEPESDYIVLCNPSVLDFGIEPGTCSKCFRINSFDTCDVNEDTVFRVEAGDINITFTAATAPIGELLCSEAAIGSIIFSIDCDVEGQCTKVYTLPDDDLDIEPTTECNSGAQTFTVTFPSTDESGTCNVQRVEIGGLTLSSANNFTGTLAFGSYSGTVYWDCGCDPTEVFVQEDCCDFILSPTPRS
jgi:hypothetical protein